jgi:hypothetical protein
MTWNPPSPPRLLASATAGSGLLGAVVGWVMMRGAYRFDRALADDHTSPGFVSFSWTNAAFQMTTVILVVVSMSLTFAALAVALFLTHRHRLDPLPHRRNSRPANAAPRSALDVLRATNQPID